MVESWKSIPGYEGLYEASTFGNIRSLELRVAYKDGRFRVQAGRILKHGDQVGYARVNLAKNGKIFPCYVQCGDNLELLKSQPNESVNMIYCDILYGTGRNFGDYQDLKPIRSDIESHYLPRLIEMKRVLKQNGSIYLQMDTRINHWMRCLMDDVFGYGNFRNEISWGYSSGGGTKRKYASKHDIILFYTVSNEYIFNNPKMKVYQKKKYSFSTVKEYQDMDGWYHLSTCSDFFNDIKTDWHNNMSLGLFKNNSDKKQDALYPTQKPKELISRFVLASTNEGDVVADYYLGSGTTAKVCQELNRNFIGCDLNPKAIEITKARLNGGQ